ncbi:MAG: hypothetical protein WC732_02780 [Candidatus Omnitrophota bacterium]
MTVKPHFSFSRLIRILAAGAFLALVVFLGFRVAAVLRESQVLKQVIGRLKAESRIAQVLVTDTRTDPDSGKTLTTIKFLEYDAGGRPLAPRYFTFSGNIIQFQSLVVRFRDFYVEKGDPARGKSVYLFLKVFFLDGEKTQEYALTEFYRVPRGYEIAKTDAYSAGVQEAFWKEFWEYSLDQRSAERAGIKNAQIEAPGTLFVPGMLYTIKIEHDGGMRIDAQPLPDILKGEVIRF